MWSGGTGARRAPQPTPRDSTRPRRRPATRDRRNTKPASSRPTQRPGRPHANDALPVGRHRRNGNHTQIERLHNDVAPRGHVPRAGRRGPAELLSQELELGEGRAYVRGFSGHGRVRLFVLNTIAEHREAQDRDGQREAKCAKETPQSGTAPRRRRFRATRPVAHHRRPRSTSQRIRRLGTSPPGTPERHCCVPLDTGG